jgi:hypothetical protein
LLEMLHLIQTVNRVSSLCASMEALGSTVPVSHTADSHVVSRDNICYCQTTRMHCLVCTWPGSASYEPCIVCC